MTIILFLVDTSASMNFKSYMGLTFLDIAKQSIENFLKLRSKDPESRMDRYMLMSFEEQPFHIKAGWKENHATFMNELKNLKANGLTNLGQALKRAFDLLNINRAYSGIDMFGQGRYPNYIEPAMIICFSDGQPLTSATGSDAELHIPLVSTVPGFDLIKEPFRWDQRLYSVVIQYPSITPLSFDNGDNFRNIPAASGTPLDAICQETGGRSFAVGNHLSMTTCLDQLTHKLQHGVVVRLEKLEEPDSIISIPMEMNHDGDSNSNSNSSNKGPPPARVSTEGWQNCRCLLYVKRSATAQRGFAESHWPMPESFWIDSTNTYLPPRSAQPTIMFSNRPVEPTVIENFPFDKYELEPCALSQYVLDNLQPNYCWQVFVENSCKHSATKAGEPFGYLKASTQMTCVNLFVHPYNYPVALKLMDDFIRRLQLKPTKEWQMHFERYLWTMPAYYASSWRKALGRLGAAPGLVPDQMENCSIHSTVLNHLKKIKQAGREKFDELAQQVIKTLGAPVSKPLMRITSRTSNANILNHPMFSILSEQPAFSQNSIAHALKDVYIAGGGGYLRQASDEDPNRPPVHKNPFALKRAELIDMVTLLRRSLLTGDAVERALLLSKDMVHRLPINQMGNYQAYLERQPPALRELEPSSQRVNTFGNPFKTNKNMMIDEADEAVVMNKPSGRTRSLSISSIGSGRGARKGPLAKDYVFVPAKKRKRHDSSSSLASSQMFSPPSSPAASLRSPFSPGSDSEFIDLTDENNNLNISINQKLVHLHKKQEESLKIIRKEIRRPGLKHPALFDHLRELQSEFDDVYTIMLREACFEARRLKRFKLADKIYDLVKAADRLAEMEENDKEPVLLIDDS